MFRSPKLWAVVSLLVIASMVLAGCGATPTATPVPPTATKPAAVAPTAAPAAPTATKPAAVAATAVPATAVPPTAAPASKAPTFIFGAQADPVCIDPALITDGVSGRVVNQIFEGLV